MAIQLNKDKNLKVHEAFGARPHNLLTEKLNRFSEPAACLEVHLPDDIGFKAGKNDKICSPEAGFDGRKPITVTGFANTYELTVNSAFDKLQASLETILERLRNN